MHIRSAIAWLVLTIAAAALVGCSKKVEPTVATPTPGVTGAATSEKDTPALPPSEKPE
jgi:hypothetical protein